MKLLLIEDDEYKANQINQFLQSKGHNIDIAKSYNTGMKKLVFEKYEMALIDMTIPSFEIVPDHPTSRIRKYGGKDIISEMDRRGIKIPSIVITQYKVFDDGEKTLDSLDKELTEGFPQLYKGIIYYNSSAMDWQDKLLEKIGE